MAWIRLFAIFARISFLVNVLGALEAFVILLHMNILYLNKLFVSLRIVDESCHVRGVLVNIFAKTEDELPQLNYLVILSNFPLLWKDMSLLLGLIRNLFLSRLIMNI